VNLSSTPTDSEHPAIVADLSGTIHVFWGENYDTSTGAPDAIYYTRGDGASWSPPVDVLVSPGMPQAANRYPAVAAGGDGRLHVVWEGGYDGRIFYSSARAADATRSSAWAPALELNYDVERATHPDIVVGADGDLHAVFAVPEGPQQGMYYAKSAGSGGTWSATRHVSGTALGADKYLTHPRVAVGQDGTVHLVWEWWTVGVLYMGNGVLYTRSADGGTTWDLPLVIADGPFGQPDVAAVGENEVLLIWAGTADQRHRFSQWSTDGGLTWSAPLQDNQLGGFSGYSGMAVDSAGVVHVAFTATDYRQETRPNTLVHLEWVRGVWSRPDVVAVEYAVNADPQGVGVAVSAGNLVTVVSQWPVDVPGRAQNWDFEISYWQRRVGSPVIAPVPSPTAQPGESGRSVAPSPSVTLTPAGPVATAAPPPAGSEPQGGTAPATAVGAGVVSAAIVIAIGAMVRIARRGRR
jgi:hypothetical protein